MSDCIQNNLADNTPLQKFELSLSKVIAKGKSKKEADFREVYNAIEQHLANGVKIVCPPPQHSFSLTKVFGFVDIGTSNLVSFLMPHVTFNSITLPQA